MEMASGAESKSMDFQPHTYLFPPIFPLFPPIFLYFPHFLPIFSHFSSFFFRTGVAGFVSTHFRTVTETLFS